MTRAEAIEAAAREKCSCPIYCRYCGRRRSKDVVGHYCKTHNCQWQHGYTTCLPSPPTNEVQQ